MDAAKSAGARGGTVIEARGIGYEEAEKFLGVSIQAEKTIVAILCKKEEKHNIMLAINKEAGLKTQARGVLISMPVSDILGINGLESID
ncbi:MAG: P-II family nitrogen regulator, partial [Clostridiaceae bacterium]|nr:P-II family nitrogen regulator [Clostridiaceae bacterium]